MHATSRKYCKYLVHLKLNKIHRYYKHIFGWFLSGVGRQSPAMTNGQYLPRELTFVFILFCQFWNLLGIIFEVFKTVKIYLPTNRVHPALSVLLTSRSVYHILECFKSLIKIDNIRPFYFINSNRISVVYILNSFVSWM